MGIQSLYHPYILFLLFPTNPKPYTLHVGFPANTRRLMLQKGGRTAGKGRGALRYPFILILCLLRSYIESVFFYSLLRTTK